MHVPSSTAGRLTRYNAASGGVTATPGSTTSSGARPARAPDGSARAGLAPAERVAPHAGPAGELADSPAPHQPVLPARHRTRPPTPRRPPDPRHGAIQPRTVGRMRRRRAQQRSEARLLAELESAIRPRRSATIIGYAWWWRYEVGIVLATTATTVLLVHAFGMARAALGISATIGAYALWPPAQRACVIIAWHIITPHRLRVGFAQARIHSRNGRLPTILRTSHQPFGERVRVWCPAGVSVSDLRSARDVLATACWTADIRVIADPRHAHLATIDVIRRPAQRPPGVRASRRRSVRCRDHTRPDSLE
jgi:hypothetical protein